MSVNSYGCESAQPNPSMIKYSSEQSSEHHSNPSHLGSSVNTRRSLELNCRLLTLCLSLYRQLQGLVVGASLFYVGSNPFGQSLEMVLKIKL